MQRGKAQAHRQPDAPEADTMPCCIHLVTTPATHVQRQAWACLWRILLMVDVDHHGSPARGAKGAQHGQKH